MIVTVAGQPTYLSTGGQPLDSAKPVALLLHGAGLDHSVWTMPARYLAHHGHTVVAPDLPGHGRSGGTPLPSVAAMAVWCWQLLDALGPPRAAIAGHSMGALIALAMGAGEPDRTTSLLLVGAAAAMPVHPDLLTAAREDRNLASALISMWGFGPAGQVGGNAVPGLQMRLTGQRLLERARPGVLAADLSACNDYGTGAGDAAKLRAPTTLLLGAEDRMTPAGKGKQLAAQMTGVPGGARVVILPGCGHMVMAECPNETIDALRAL